MRVPLVAKVIVSIVRTLVMIVVIFMNMVLVLITTRVTGLGYVHSSDDDFMEFLIQDNTMHRLILSRVFKSLL